MTEQCHSWVYIQKKAKILIHEDTHNLMFTAALFKTAKTRKQSKCQPTDKWIKKMCYIYTMDYYSAIKKEPNFAICSNMDEFGGH